jgi:hypothetical protein
MQRLHFFDLLRLDVYQLPECQRRALRSEFSSGVFTSDQGGRVLSPLKASEVTSRSQLEWQNLIRRIHAPRQS